MADNIARFVSYLLSATLFCFPGCAFASEANKPVTLPECAITGVRAADGNYWSLLDADKETFKNVLDALKNGECAALTQEQSDCLKLSPAAQSIFPQTVFACEAKEGGSFELSLTPLYNLPDRMPKDLVRVNAAGVESYIVSQKLSSIVRSLSVPSIEMEDINSAVSVVMKLADAPEEASCDKSLSDIADALMYCEPLESYTEIKALAEMNFKLDGESHVAVHLFSADGKVAMLWYSELFMLDDTDMLNSALKSAGLPSLC